jgi:hypothetical protein
MVCSTKGKFQSATAPDPAISPSSSWEKSVADAENLQELEGFISEEDKYWQEQEAKILRLRQEAQMSDWRRQSDGVRDFFGLPDICDTGR